MSWPLTQAVSGRRVAFASVNESFAYPFVRVTGETLDRSRSVPYSRVRRRAAGCRAARGLGPNRLQVKPETQFRWAEERAFHSR